MNKKLLAALITSVIGIGIIVLRVMNAHKANPQGYGVFFEIAIVMAVEFFIMLFTGVILTMDQKTKPLGQGVLLGMLITMVVGFGICTGA